MKVWSIMKTEYTEFNYILSNGETCRVRYCDQWGSPLFGKRTIHFEFRDCLAISPTKYRSEFRIVGEHESIDPQKAAEQIINELTGIKLNEQNTQQKLL
jgi:hypothetical protein